MGTPQASCAAVTAGTGFTVTLAGAEPDHLYLLEIGGTTDATHTLTGQVTDAAGGASYTQPLAGWAPGDYKVRWGEYPHGRQVAACTLTVP